MESVPDPWTGPDGRLWAIWGLCGPVSVCFRPSWPIPRGHREQAGRGPECPKMAQNRSGDPWIRWVTCSRAEGSPPFPNRHMPNVNRQSPTAINRHQPPTATNRQPTTRPDGPENGQKYKVSKVVPDPWGGSNGPLWAVLPRFQPLSAVLAHFSPVPCLETGMEFSLGPKPVKTISFKRGPRPFGRVERTF